MLLMKPCWNFSAGFLINIFLGAAAVEYSWWSMAGEGQDHLTLLPCGHKIIFLDQLAMGTACI